MSKRRRNPSREPQVAPDDATPVTEAQAGAEPESVHEDGLPIEASDNAEPDHPLVALDALGLPDEQADQLKRFIAQQIAAGIAAAEAERARVQQDTGPRPPDGDPSGLAGVDAEEEFEEVTAPGRVHEQSMHTTHAQEMQPETMHGDFDYSKPWAPPSLLPEIPARPGMVQKWCRIAVFGVDDAANLSRFQNQGWLARRLDTVGKEYHPPTLAHGAHSGCVVVKDLILCEMPVERSRQRNAYYAEKQRRQSSEVDKAIVETTRSAHGYPGMGPIVRSHQSHDDIGRVPEVAPDEI